MVNTFGNYLQKLEVEPRVLVVRLLTSCFAVSVIAALIGLLSPSGKWNLMFRERYPITLLSFVLILVIALLCREIYRVRKGSQFSWQNPATLWLLLSIGFFYLALDELLQLHENIDRAIHKMLGWSETALTDRIDDFILFVYACIGGMVVFHYRSEFKKFGPAWSYLVLAFVTAVVTIVFDAMTNGGVFVPGLFSDANHGALAQELLGFLEEYGKLAAQVFFIGAFYICWRIEADAASK